MNGTNGNGATKKIAVGVATTIIATAGLFLGSGVLSNANRITALEVKFEAIDRALETNRLENREEHREIAKSLVEIKDAIK